MSEAKRLQGRFILLNGACSSGKSSIAKSLQNLLVEPNILLGTDAYHLAIPEEKLNLNNPDKNYLWADQWVENSMPMTVVNHGPIIKKINEARFLSAGHFLEQGISIIADELFWELDDITRFLRLMQGFQVILIKVSVNESIGEQRLATRCQGSNENLDNFATNFRPSGMCRASANVTHRFMDYDFTIDSSDKSILACAESVNTWLRTLKEPRAFKRLTALYGPFN